MNYVVNGPVEGKAKQNKVKKTRRDKLSDQAKAKSKRNNLVERESFRNGVISSTKKKS